MPFLQSRLFFSNQGLSFKNKSFMKSTLTFFICSFLYAAAIGQNVGIHTSAPTRGKLVVAGAIGRTNAIISGAASSIGISIQANYPALGFNQYFTDQSRYINTASKAGVWWLDMITGSLKCDISYTTGTKDNPITDLARVATISQNGNVSLNAAEANASLFVGYSATNYITRFQGTTYHSEFNNFIDAAPDIYSTTINAGKQGSAVYINDQSSGAIVVASRLGVNMDPVADLDIRQFFRGFVLVEPSTFHNWEFIATKNLTDPASDFYLYYNGAYRGNFFYGDGAWYSASDVRLKKEVRPIETSLQKILGLRTVQYHMKDYKRGENKIFGFIAQQVETYFPELVNKIKDKEMGYEGLGEVYTMSYNGLVPVIIASIQEQQTQIRQLENFNLELREKIERLKNLKATNNE
jgi:Chaperone of endosialidase